MEEDLMPPFDADQPDKIEADLEDTNSELPPHVIAGLKKAMAECDAGQTISFEEFKQKHFLSRKRN